MRRVASVLAALLCVAALPARAAEAASPAAGQRGCVAERAELVMGTIARVALYDDQTRAEALQVLEAALAAFRGVDAGMSLYREESELVRVNRRAAEHPEPVSAELFALLERARSLSMLSDGAFDVTVLPLLRARGGYRELAYLPRGSAAAIGFTALQLDPGTHEVSFRRPGMGLDLGGIAKGFALDRARAALAGERVQSARLDLGGEVAFLGAGPEGDWRVAVREPGAPGRAFGILTLPPDSAVSTSANYARDFAAEGWRAPSHIYDPRTGRPVTRPLAVTVWTPDATTGDALSTALMVLGPEEAPRVLARVPEAGALFIDGTGSERRLTLQGRRPVAWEPEPGPEGRSP